MPEDLDSDGQPLSQSFNWDRRLDRGMDELVGLVRGVLADGMLVIQEARFLFDWLERNEPVRLDYFGKRLHQELRSVLADGVLDAHEEDSLINLLLQFIGGTPVNRSSGSYSTTLPVDNPPPAVCFLARTFCFTGKFEFGTRPQCEACVKWAGGAIHKYPTLQTNYVVIGELGSRDWVHSNSGRKIERAIEIREQGKPLAILAEAHWINCEQVRDYQSSLRAKRVIEPI